MRTHAVVASIVMLAIVSALPGAAVAVGLIRVDGSSSVYPITSALVAEFGRIRDGQPVAVGFSGTTAGFRKFCAGMTEINDASRPITAEEMTACRANEVAYIELPIAFDAVTLVANAGNGFVECLNVADLRRVWEPAAEGRLTSWRQVNARWPDLPLRLYGAGADSGTFDYFTEAVVGEARAQRRDVTASEDDEVIVAGVQADAGALGYLPLAYVAEHAAKLKIVEISWKTPQCFGPSELNVRNARYQPLSRPLFMYVSAEAAARPEVADFVTYALSRAGIVATRVGFVALPGEGYALAAERFKAGRTGTVFGGEPQIGLRIRDLLARELRS